LEENVKEFGLTYFGITDRRQGIVHIIGPEQGFTVCSHYALVWSLLIFLSAPGITCVCGDSHTSTHGAFGSLAFGIGASEVEHVLATQTLLQKKEKNMRITVDGELLEGVTSKDVILHIIGYAIDMEARMSVCNMSIEAGARVGMIAPDEGAHFDEQVSIRAEDIVPTVTWGTSPQDVIPITGVVPDPALIADPVRRSSVERSLKYMGLSPNTRMEDIVLDKVFIGSCTNSRIEDLRSRRRFKRAGFDWREAGCSMCLGMNPDQLSPGQRCASTSNRNFEGRQGADVRKLLGVDLSSGINLKTANAFDFLTDPVLPPPEPEKPAQSDTSSKSKELPPTETLSSVAKFTVFLKTLKRSGLANAAFYALRKDPHTGEDTDFVLNRVPYNRAKILVCTGKNFGCGSSREHAPWSLNDFGIRCIIAPSFADIFRNNMIQNGMLPVTLSEEECRALAEDAETGLELEVDLEKQEVRRPNGKSAIRFTTDPFRRHCLLNGLDDIGLTLQKLEVVEKFEQRRSEVWPWLDGLGYKGKKIPCAVREDGLVRRGG
ncbi:hypothetical protein BGW80DRAFT_1311152, partial [Lactifluus volemus]